MSRLSLGLIVSLALVLILPAGAAHADGGGALYVNCGGKAGLTSVGAALKALQYLPGRGSGTINVSGACHENVVVQGQDRVTLNALGGASISDASGGTLDVILVQDSRDVAINGFTIYGGGGVGNGVDCSEYSLCRLSGNVIQGAGNAGVAVYAASNLTLDGDTLQSNGSAGLLVRTGSTVRGGGPSRPVTAQYNGQGINIARDALTVLGVVITHNTGVGAHAMFNSTLDLSGTISNNGSVGVYVHEASVTRLISTAINGNGGPGVRVEDLSMVTFDGDNISGNGGGTDVVCNPQFGITRGVGGTGAVTNCSEPP